MLIRATDSVLIVIDVQERLVPAMRAPACALRNMGLLLAAAEACGVPAILTEQYPKGLGHTVPEIAAAAGDSPRIEKLHFSCLRDEGFAATFDRLGRGQAVLAGMEAHVCVLQSAASLFEAGHEVFVACDATAARTQESEHVSRTRLAAAGIGVVTTEMVVYEWMGRAGTPVFETLLPRIKH